MINNEVIINSTPLHKFGTIESIEYSKLSNDILYREIANRQPRVQGRKRQLKEVTLKIRIHDKLSRAETKKQIDEIVGLSFSDSPISLIENGNITVDQNTEVRQAMTKNPRTAIGIVDSNHYILVVSDGRTSESEGLSLYELAEVMKEYGATTAYNLDGGGSSTMYYNGNIINNPTTNGHNISEREVSDIVYIGY